MSHNFLKYIKIFASNNNIKFEPFVLLLTIPHLTYVFSTQKEDNIVIINKYKYVSNGYTNFMIVDANGTHYNVNNSFWFWKWDSIEDWNKLKVGNTIYAKYYGILKDKTKIENEHHLISIDPVLTTNKDLNNNNRIHRDVITAALATFK